MGIKESIGWTDMTLNPIKGRCKGGCWYCYYSGKRGMLNRFKQDPRIRLECKVFYNLPSKPKRIFLCSTHDLFGSWIPDKWRDMIFKCVESWPRHTFQILTKFPENIDRRMPENVWLGASITGEDDEQDIKRIFSLIGKKTKLKFISFEPLLGRIDISVLNQLYDIQWVIIGRLTGFGKKYDPEIEWIDDILEFTDHYQIPVFLKNNLKEIWGKPLIQQFPKEGL